MDNNIQNVNNHPIEIPGVEIPGVDNNLQDENNHPGLDNDEKSRYIVPNDRHGDGLNMNLRNVSRINYKFIHNGKKIPMNNEEEMIFLHLNDKNDIEEDLIVVHWNFISIMYEFVVYSQYEPKKCIENKLQIHT